MYNTSVKLIKFILYFIIFLLMNERNLRNILRNTLLSEDYHIFRINSKKNCLRIRIRKRWKINRTEIKINLH